MRLGALVGDQRVVRDRQRHARGQQQRGVDRRQRPRAHGAKGSTVPAGEAVDAGQHARPDGLEVGPQDLVVQVAEHRHRMHAGPVQRAEEGGEEHHLREDEPAHAPAEGDVDALRVQAAFALRRWPCGTSWNSTLSQIDQAEQQRIRAPAMAVDPLAGAEDHEEQPSGHQHRVARRRRNEVVGRGAGVCRWPTWICCSSILGTNELN